MSKTRLLNQLVVRSVLVLLTVAVVVDVANADSASIEAVKRQTISFAREIRSIEFEMVSVGNDVNRESGERISRVETMRYFQSGNMFRSETGIALNSESLGDEISTYTGERFQVFHKDIETMTLKDESLRPNAPRVVSPFVGLFSFLAKMGMNATWTELTAEKNIDDTFKQAKYVGIREYNGSECVVLEFPGVVPGFTSEVWFSREHGHLPVKSVVSANRSTISVGEVKRLHEVTLDGGTRIFIPVEIVLASNFPGRSVYSSSTSTVTVDPNSIKINHEIDDDFFTLPTTAARHVKDIDQMLADGTLELRDYVIEERSSSPFRTVLVIFNAVFVIVFIVLIGYRLYLTKFKKNHERI